MSELSMQLKQQERLHRKSGANALADLFMNAASELEQQQRKIDEMSSLCLTNAEVDEIKSIQAERSFKMGAEWQVERGMPDGYFEEENQISERIEASEEHADEIRNGES